MSDDESPVASGKAAKITDFPRVLGELAELIVTRAKVLPKNQLDLQLDAFKAATAYFSALNRAPDGDEGSGILDMREQLIRPTPAMTETPEEEEPDGGTEDA